MPYTGSPIENVAQIASLIIQAKQQEKDRQQQERQSQRGFQQQERQSQRGFQQNQDELAFNAYKYANPQETNTQRNFRTFQGTSGYRSLGTEGRAQAERSVFGGRTIGDVAAAKSEPAESFTEHHAKVRGANGMEPFNYLLGNRGTILHMDKTPLTTPEQLALGKAEPWLMDYLSSMMQSAEELRTQMGGGPAPPPSVLSQHNNPPGATAPPGQPPGTLVGKMPDGRPVYRTPTGEYVDQNGNPF